MHYIKFSEIVNTFNGRFERGRSSSIKILKTKTPKIEEF